MYCCPGDSIRLSLNAEEFDESIQYTGIGSNKNNFLAEFYLKFEDYSDDIIQFYNIKDTAIQVFIELADKTTKETKGFFNERNAEYAFPEAFTNYFNTKLYFMHIDKLGWIARGKDKDTTPEYKQLKEQAFNQVINAGKYENPDPLCSEYRTWFNYNLPRMVGSEVRKEMDEFNMKTYDSLLNIRIQDYINPAAFKIYLLNKADMYCESFNSEFIVNLKAWVDQYIDDPEINKEIGKMYDDMMEKLSQPLPEDAELYNLDDEALSDLSFNDVLAKYKGKVIYLDFWASWCGPCKAEMPNSAKLSKKLTEEEVVFLYVSTDKDAEAWDRMIRVMQLHGIHYRLGENVRKPVFDEYGIRYIPHYVIFDKEGNMVKNNMTRPSDPETEKMIRELL